jgi:transcriptional regulator with XRE-family HTH domain
LNKKERESAGRIAGLMRVARKRSSLTQTAVADGLGISQSALSKMESARLIPSAPQWFTFCEITKISPDCMTLGYIERNKPATLGRGEVEGGFRLPKQFAEFRGSKIRAVMPFVIVFREAFGEEKFNQYLESLKLDPDFFMDLDNQISLNFVLETMRTLVSRGDFKSKDFSKMSRAMVQPRVHGGALYKDLEVAPNPIMRMKSLVGHARQYECNFRYGIAEDAPTRLVLTIEPEPHLEAFDYRNDPVLGNALCLYKQHYFHEVTGCCGEAKPGLKVREIECHFKGAERCVYELKTG